VEATPEALAAHQLAGCRAVAALQCRADTGRTRGSADRGGSADGRDAALGVDSPFTKRRCLAPVSGFYEWKKQELPKAPKQPFYIARADREPLMLAGVWEHWERGGEAIDSFTIITTTPNAIMAELHDRMPVIVESEDVDRWLDPETTDAAAFTSILRPAADGVLEAIPVSTRVNTPKNDDPSLILPEVEPPQGLFGQ